MTEGEKLVWAAAYATKYMENMQPSRIPKECLVPSGDKKWHEWEQSQVANAIEHASCAVRYMREAQTRVREGWGPGSETYLMLEEMLLR
jgi:hypothetical protein